MRSAVIFTGIMTGTIALFAFCFGLISASPATAFQPTSFLLSAMMGVLFAINIPIYGKAMTLGSLGLCGVFLNLGSLVLPFLYAILFVGEEMTVWKIAGLLLAVSAVLLQIPKRAKKAENTEKSPETKKNLLFFLFGIGMFLINGTFCVLLKIQAGLDVQPTNQQTLFWTGVFGAAISFAVLGFSFLKNGRGSADDRSLALPQKKTLFFPMIYGMLNGGMNFLNLLIASPASAFYVDTAVQFSVLSCGGLLLNTLLGVIFFKDKFRIKTMITILLAVGAILCFSF